MVQEEHLVLCLKLQLPNALVFFLDCRTQTHARSHHECTLWLKRMFAEVLILEDYKDVLAAEAKLASGIDLNTGHNENCIFFKKTFKKCVRRK